MKKIIISAIVTLAFISFTTSCNSDNDDKKTVISAGELPAPIVAFVAEHFPNTTYVFIEKESKPESDGTVYNIKLTNNFEIDFDIDGNWVDIDANHQPVPSALIPQKISTYVATNYSSFYVTSIDNERTNVEVELSNNIELVFDLNGNFVRIDH